MANHTPAPWKVILSQPFRNERVFAGSRFIAFVSNTDNLNGANARLIAAAPELLEDLQEAIGEMACGCGHPSCRTCQRVSRWKDTVNKALGEK